MKNFVSPHVHVKSLDSASSPEQFAKRELELETGYIVVTDHGTLEATRQVYDLTRDKKDFKALKPILGVEGYFRDDQCPYLIDAGAPRDQKGVHEGTFAKHFKYGHLTLHAIDEQGYFALSRVLSQADLRAEQHGKERKPLFTWSNLEELGQHNVTVTSGCLIGMVGRHLVKNNDPRTAFRYYDRLRSIFKPGNFYVELFPHRCNSYWESKVVIDHGEGIEPSRVPKYKQFKTKGAPDGIKAAELLEELADMGINALRKKHVEIYEIMNNRAWEKLDKPLPIVNFGKQEGEVQNECRPWCPDGDVQLGVNEFVLKLAAKFGDPVLLSDDSHFAYPEEKIVQDIRLSQGDDTWRFVNSHHRMTSAEAWDYCRDRLGATEAQFEGWVQSTHDWASRFRDFKFSPRQTLPTSFYPKDTFRHTVELIKRHGRLDPQDPAQMARLKAEFDLLTQNGINLLPYFMIDEEVCREYLKRGLLTGPGRGSAAGMQLSYDLGITHVDPLRFKLSMERFMTPDRIQTGKLPDIDQDLPTREPLVGTDERGGWLQERFGDCVAQISVDTTLKLRSAIKDTFRAKYGQVPEAVEVLCKQLPVPPQGIPDRDYVFGYKDSDGHWVAGLVDTDKVLQSFIATYPIEWETVKMLLGLARQKSRHACAYVISNEPISNFIPLMTVGGVRVTSFTAPAVEAMGGLKMDFLVVNSLKDIGHAITLIRDRVIPNQEYQVDEDGVPFVTIKGRKVPKIRVVPWKGELVDIWDLPEDPAVFHDICTGKVETVFQFDAGAARQGLRQFEPMPDGRLPLKSIEDLAVFTALDRPGPLDCPVKASDGTEHNMLVEFANRARGKARAGALPILDEMLPETLGVIVYQEQLQHVFQQVGGTTAIDANNFRQRISKKKLVDVNKIDKPLFMKGATQKLGPEVAETLWGMMQTFGQYGFNKSHAVCYVIIGYACAFLKHHYPLEWWTAVLGNADRNEIDEKFWRYCGHLIDLPDIRYSEPTFCIKNERIRAPINLLRGLGDKAMEQLVGNGPYENIEDFLLKIEDWKKKNPMLKDGKPVLKKDGTARSGVTALNEGVIVNLILSGALDSLFREVDVLGEPVTVEDRLKDYAFAAQKIKDSGKKKKRTKPDEVKPIATGYALDNKLVRYQVRKKVLPAYNEPLVNLLRNTGEQRITKRTDADTGEQRRTFVTLSEDGKSTDHWRILNGEQFDILENIDLMPPIEMRIAMLGYVVKERRFSYKKKDTGEGRTACELTLDVDGVRVNVVKWPSKLGLPTSFNQPLTGAIVACLFIRGQNRDSFFMADVVILAPQLTKAVPTKDKKEESPDAEGSP